MQHTARINFLWLLRLRWGAIVGQVLTILGVEFVLAIPLPLRPLFAIVGIEVITNAVCALWVTRGRPVEPPLLGMVMGGDVILLTALLYLTGGAFNPFSFLYLVHIALAAVVLSATWTWALVALSLVCFGSLFQLPPWPVVAGGELRAEHMHMHLQGMWVAFAVAAMFIVYFVQRVTLALAERERQLAEARDLTARNEKLASLATLAAGAAHELSTPLSTIAVVAKELEYQMQRREAHAEFVADARLIRQQVTRCREILVQMTADAGETMGEANESVSLAALLREAIEGLHDAGQIRVQMNDAVSRLLTVPRSPTVQAIRNILKNAQEASNNSHPVDVRVESLADECCIEVRDLGIGMSPEVLGRAGEPFFTTREPGRGMGLGLFLSRAVASRLGGRLELSSQIGRGTTVRLSLPIRPLVHPTESSKAA